MAKLEGRWDKTEVPVIFIFLNTLMVCAWAADSNTSSTWSSAELLNNRIRMFKIAGFFWDTSLPYYTILLGADGNGSSPPTPCNPSVLMLIKCQSVRLVETILNQSNTHDLLPSLLLWHCSQLNCCNNLSLETRSSSDWVTGETRNIHHNIQQQYYNQRQTIMI